MINKDRLPELKMINAADCSFVNQPIAKPIVSSFNFYTGHKSKQFYIVLLYCLGSTIPHTYLILY